MNDKPYNFYVLRLSYRLHSSNCLLPQQLPKPPAYRRGIKHGLHNNINISDTE